MDDLLLNKAFDVEIEENFKPSGIPATGLEYLKHVMYEASKCPQVVVADVACKNINNHVDSILSSSPKEKSELLPSIEWQQKQIAMFSELRKKVETCKKSDKLKPMSLPKANDEDSWQALCFGDETSRKEPSLSLLLSMGEPLLIRVLEYQGEWLEDGLRVNQGKWIYSLMACLELPLMPETCSALRELARKCAKIRSTKTSIDDGDVVALNLIICLVSKYFGQTDLGD